MPSAAKRSAAPASTEDLASAWVRVVEKASEASRVTGAVAEGTKPTQLSAGVLSVFPGPGIRGRLTPGSLDFTNLETIVAEVFGVGTRLSISDGAAPASHGTQRVPDVRRTQSVPPPAPSVPPKAEPEPPKAVAQEPEPESGPEPKVEPESAPQDESAPQPVTEAEDSGGAPDWYGDVSADDETIEAAPNRGVPALLEVLGGTVIDQEEEL